MRGRARIPAGGPLPQVHDVWRAGAPTSTFWRRISICDISTRSASASRATAIRCSSRKPGPIAANVIVAVGKYNSIGFSPFGIDGNRPIPRDLAATYSMLDQMAPMILAHQGTDAMTAVRMNPGRRAQAGQAGQLHADLHLYGPDAAPAPAAPGRGGGVAASAGVRRGIP